MPSEKRRDFEDTWAPEELHRSLKSKDDKKRSSTRDRDRDRKKDDDRKSRTREGEKKDRDKDKDREKRERDKDKDKDRERRHKDRTGEEKKHRDRDDKEKRKRTDEGDRRRHREDRDDKDRKKDRDDKDKKRHREEKDEDGKRRRHREENGERSSKPKDEKRDRRRRDGDDKKEKRSKTEEESRHHRRRDETEEEREERRRRRREREGNEDKEREGRRRDRHRAEHVDSDEGEKKTSSSKKKEEVSKKGDDADDYEDDFEDYEDDFEDDDNDDEDEDEGVGSDAGNDAMPDGMNNKTDGKSRDEMDEILKAMNEENERLLKESRRSKRREPESDEEDTRNSAARPTTASKKKFINFHSAKERQVAMKSLSKAARRGRELLQIVDLDFVGYDMFDMPPVNEYELYMRTYGQSDMKQTYVQTNEDDVEREIQTEEIETTEKWTQYPPEDIRGWGGGDEEPVDPELGASKPIDSVGLSKFVTKAGTVMCVLLEEEKSQSSSSGSMTQRKSNVCVSDGFVELSQNALIQGRYVSATWVSPVQGQMLLTLHTETADNQSTLPGKGLLCVWNLNEPSQPNKYLVCEGQPKCCCFSPGSSNLAFAGMQDGSLAVWDLREQMSLHKSTTVKDEEFLLRYPTYNTAHVMSSSSHLSAVVAVTPVTAAGESAMDSLELNSDANIEGSSSFQIASLEENSIIHLWVSAELSQPDPAGSESDLGLLPGGKVKLLPSSSILLENPSRESRTRTTMQSIDMVLNPKDPSHYYVATDTGCIIHGVRYGGKAPPKAYRGDQDVLLEVMSLDFSPFSVPVFLAGCIDGSLRMYSTKSETPILSWPNVTEGRPIKCVRWCKSRPSVFFILDDSSNLQIWDLNMNDSGPLKEEKVSEERVTSFALTNDHSATGTGVPGRKPQMVLCLESGSIEVHTVSKEFSAMMPEEIDQFSTFIENVM